MSFWNFLGGFALFNFVCDLFSGGSKKQHRAPLSSSSSTTPYQPNGHDPYYSRNDDRAYYDDYIDDLESRLDDLEDRLDCCDPYSDRYDELRDEIDSLRDDIDDYSINDFDDDY